MNEKIIRFLDKVLKRKVYIICDAYFNPATSSFDGVGEEWAGFYGSKKAAEKEIHDRGYKKKNVVVRRQTGWETKPYWKEIYVERSAYGLGNFYAVILEKELTW